MFSEETAATPLSSSSAPLLTLGRAASVEAMSSIVNLPLG